MKEGECFNIYDSSCGVAARIHAHSEEFSKLVNTKYKKPASLNLKLTRFERDKETKHMKLQAETEFLLKQHYYGKKTEYSII